MLHLTPGNKNCVTAQLIAFENDNNSLLVMYNDRKGHNKRIIIDTLYTKRCCFKILKLKYIKYVGKHH